MVSFRLTKVHEIVAQARVVLQRERDQGGEVSKSGTAWGPRLWAIRLLVTRQAGVGVQLDRLPVRVEQPDTPVAVMVEQTRGVALVHLPRPDHLGPLDVGPVVYPLDLSARIIRRPI